MLSGPGAFPRVNLLMHLSYISRVNWVLISELCGPLLSSMIPLFVCHGYLRMTHIHAFGWSMVSSYNGARLWNDVCWIWYISVAMSMGLVRIWPLELCMQWRELAVVGWKIFLWIVFGLMFSNVLYFVIAVRQLIDVCLVTILCVWVLAFLPMVASLSIHCMYYIWLVGRGRVLIVGISSSDYISGLCCRCVYGCWHAIRIAFRMVWWIFNWCFHVFYCVRGRNPPWALARVGSGGIGCVMQVFSVHLLSELMMSWRWFCASSHCIGVSWSW